MSVPLVALRLGGVFLYYGGMTKTDLLSEHLPTSIIGFLKHSLSSEEFEVIPLAGDASARRYYRIALEDKTYVLMEWEPYKEADYPFLSVLRHFERHNVNTPKVIDMAPDAGLLLLEDLGDLTLERKFWETQNQENIIPFYKLAIDELIKIHYNSSKEKTNSCTAFDMNFDTKKLLWELNYAKNHLLNGFLKLSFSKEEEATLEQDFTSLCEVLSSEPRYICHRDYHSRNLMLKMGNVKVIDFQDARMGPVQYDLVSLLHDSYVKINESTHDILLDYYLDQAQFFYDSPLDKNHFMEIYKLQIIQRCFKACGSFASFFMTREDLRYIHYIQPTLKKVQAFLKSTPYTAFKNLFEIQKIADQDYKKLCTPSS